MIRLHMSPVPVTVSLCLVLSACQSLPERVDDEENLLAAAGFDERPADTPARRDSLATLPANRFVEQKRGDALTYVYADPLVCQCLYVGDREAWSAYRDEVLERRLASEREMDAQMYDDEWDWSGWDWMSWGGWEGV